MTLDPPLSSASDDSAGASLSDDGTPGYKFPSDTRAKRAAKAKKAARASKDRWDKAHLVAQMLTALWTVIVAGAAAWYGYSFNRWQAEQRDVSSKEERLLQQRHLEIQRVGAVEQFLPYLLKSEPEKRAAFLAISAIADAEFTSRLAGLFPSDGAVEALGVMATAGPRDQRRHAVAALATIATRGGPGSRRAATELATLALRAHTDESRLAQDTLRHATAGYEKSVVRIQPETAAGNLLGMAVGPGVIITTLARGFKPGTRVKVLTPSGVQHAVVTKVNAERGLALLTLDENVLQGLGLASDPALPGEQVMTFAVGRTEADMASRAVEVVGGGGDRLRIAAGAASSDLVPGGPLIRMDGTVVGMVGNRAGDEYEAVGPASLRAFARTAPPPKPTPPTPPVRAKVAGEAPEPAAAPPAAPEPTPEAPALQEPVRVGGQIEQPVRIKYVEPVYPPLAVAARISGTVVIEATIAADGSVQDTRVIESSSSMLDRAALDAVRQWRYEPTRLGGTPVPVIMTVTVNFTRPQ